jgi:hypothetical protein
MHAIIRPDRIDISGSHALPTQSWEPMLDELKARHVPGRTEIGKRVLHVGNLAFIFKDGEMFEMTASDVVQILHKYGIEAHLEGDLVQGAIG